MNDDRRNSGEPTDEERMRAAIDLTGPEPSEASLEMVRRRTQLTWKKALGLLVATLAVGGLVGYLLAMRDRPWISVPVAEWRTILGWTLWAAGLVGMVWSFVTLRRSGRARSVRERLRPVQVLSAGQRRQVNRQIQGKGAVEPDQLPLLRYVAATMTGSRLRPWLLVSAVVLLLGNAVRTDDIVPWVFAGGIALLVIGSVPAGTRQYRRAGEFLERHPVPTPQATP